MSRQLMYPLESFFRNSSEARDFHKKLYDRSKDVIVFVGKGANGKTQMTNQIIYNNPEGTFRIVYQDSEHEFNKNTSKDKKVIYMTNEFSSKDLPTGFTFDVVEFPKTFFQLIEK